MNMNMSQYDPLLQPFQIKGLTLRNRIMSTSHASGHVDAGMPKESYQRYHEEKAIGGIGLTMFGGSSNVSPDSPNVFGQLNISRDNVIPYFQQFSERIHRHGAALMCQITHLGRRGSPHLDHWLPTVAPSRVRETLHRSIPKEMDEYDIQRIVREYADAAWRCLEGGLDGLETLTGGHLLGQFLSPVTNLRRDKYGGSLENRVRFTRMVHEAIRERVGDDFIVGIRYVVDEQMKGGLGFDEALRAAQILEQDGTLDFFNLIVGRMDTERALAEDNMPGMEQPLAPFLEDVGQFRAELTLPIFHAARIIHIPTARQAVQDGIVDMVAMTRAHIADPHLVRKLEQGHEKRIRPCVGAMFCLATKPSSCIHNPATSRELTLPHEITRAKQAGRKVVVVGGGPAGMEAARVSALRGHDVVLFEGTSKLGGQINLASKAGWRRELHKIVAWRASELARLSVELRLNTFVSESEILAEKPDVVILATGGKADVTGFIGTQHCLSVWDALAKPENVAQDLLIYDGTGLHPAPSTADYLASQGHDVTFVTVDGGIAQGMGYLERLVYRKHFHQHEIPIYPDLRLHKVEQMGDRLLATFVNELTDQVKSLSTSQILIEQGSTPADKLYHTLRSQSINDGVTDIQTLLAGEAQPHTGAWADDKSFELHRIGDAVASRTIHSAIYDALRLCMAM